MEDPSRCDNAEQSTGFTLVCVHMLIKSMYPEQTFGLHAMHAMHRWQWLYRQRLTVLHQEWFVLLTEHLVMQHSYSVARAT